MVLEEELRFYASQKEELLLHHRGQFALIKENRLLGTFTTFDQAFDAGVRELGNQPFLIKQVTNQEKVVQFPALTLGMIDAHS